MWDSVASPDTFTPQLGVSLPILPMTKPRIPRSWKTQTGHHRMTITSTRREVKKRPTSQEPKWNSNIVLWNSPLVFWNSETVQIISYLLVSVKDFNLRWAGRLGGTLQKEEVERKTILFLGLRVYFMQREINSGLFKKKCFQGLVLHRMLIVSDTLIENWVLFTYENCSRCKLTVITACANFK